MAERWRSPAGEIDLIARGDAGLVFVEVKQAHSHAEAAERLSPRQMGRISRAACDYLGREPDGQDTAMRIDVALVDIMGRIDICENVMIW